MIATLTEQATMATALEEAGAAANYTAQLAAYRTAYDATHPASHLCIDLRAEDDSEPADAKSSGFWFSCFV